MRAVEFVCAGRNDNTRSNLKWLGQDIVHSFDWTEEEFRRVLEHCIPRKLGLSRGELAGAIRVIFNLGLELHLLDVRNKLWPRLVRKLSKVLMNGVAFDEANFRIKLSAYIFINHNEAIEIILKDRFQPRRPRAC